jgi:hypothetical protein
MSDDPPGTRQYNARAESLSNYHTDVGRISMAWAQLETQINHAIWHLANVEQFAGACITAQIISPAQRIRALVSLVALRGGGEAQTKPLNKFSVEVDGLARRRNRVVHDPVYQDPDSTSGISRFTVTADRKLEFGMVPVREDDIIKVHNDIVDATIKFYDAMQEVLAGLPPFDDTNFRQSPGIVPVRPRVLDTPQPEQEPRP